MADAKIQFYYNLSMLLNSGAPILRAISAAAQGLCGKYRRVASQMAEEVRQGQMLSDSMERHGKCFDPFDIEMIRTGEETGQLPEMLAELSRWHEFRRQNRRTIGAGMNLPIFILHTAALVIPVVSHPRFWQGGRELMAYLLGVVGVLLFFYIPTAAILGILFLTPRRGPLRRVLDVLVMGIPVIGSAVANLSISRYSKVFAMTYGAGIPIVRASRQAANACGNWLMYKRFSGATQKAQAGENMSEGFARSLDYEFRETWKVGEESGELDRSAERLGKLYAQRAEFKFQMIAQWTPRIVYALICIYMVYKIFEGYSQIYGNAFRLLE